MDTITLNKINKCLIQYLHDDNIIIYNYSCLTRVMKSWIHGRHQE